MNLSTPSPLQFARVSLFSAAPSGPPISARLYTFQTRVDKIKLSLNLLHTLEDSQAQTTLLRSCLALPKVVSVLRACPPSHVNTTAHDFDCSIRKALESIMGGPLSDWSWQKASLPCSKGGLGLRSAPLHAPAAFLDSSLPSDRRSARLPPRPSWSKQWPLPPLAQTGRPWVTSGCPFSCHRQLCSSAPTTRSRALALSTGLPHAHDWIPSRELSLLLAWGPNDQFTCPECRCVADPFGDHQVGCGGNSDRISRHNAIRDVVFKAAQSAALGPSIETPGLIAARPADVLLLNWSNGRPAALDVHVISPRTLSEAAQTQGHALQVGVQRKLAAAMQVCHVSLLSLKLLEVWPRISFQWFKPSVVRFVSDQVPTEIRTQLNTFSAESAWLCGGAMPLCWSTDLPLCHLLWMVSPRLLFNLPFNNAITLSFTLPSLCHF